MHITALCPFCQSSYQVQASLRGQFVRCPNAACRKVFPVSADRPPGNGQHSGSVGDMVPILPSEPAAPPTASGPTSKHVSEMVPIVPSEPAAPATEGGTAERDWWQAAPPVRATPSRPAAPSSPSPSTWWSDAPPSVRDTQAPSAAPTPAEPPQPPRSARGSQAPVEPTQPIRPPAVTPRETQQMPAFRPETSDQPRELPPGMWEPPPVRRGATTDDNNPQAFEAAATSETHRPRLSKRRAWFVILGLFLLTFGVLGSAGAWVWLTFHRSEEALSHEAHEDYTNRAFSKAESEFRLLAQKFPESIHIEEYRFLAEWCVTCGAVSNPDADLSVAVAQLDEFVKEHKDHKKHPLMGQYGPDAGQELLKLAKAFTARNANPTDEGPLKLADGIEQLRRTITALGRDALTPAEAATIDADIGKVREAVAKARKRREILKALTQRPKEAPMEAIKRARDLLARMERELPGINQDAKAQAALSRLEQDHLANVIYRPRQDDTPRPLTRSDDDAETVLFDPLLRSAAPGYAPDKDRILLALVRGVLYVLKGSNGKVIWARRVGIDTSVLPQRVPASQASPELLLVLSADTQTLLALDTDGNELWEYPVGQRVLGRPIIIDQRAYLAAYDGWIHEIELSGGQLLGRWYLGQRLTRGGAREGNTSRIYFPADDSCIYVLDVSPKARRCVAILEDGHRSGSLRSEPVVIPPDGNAPGYLILNQASGLDGMQLHVFELPLQDRHAAPHTLKPPARLAGWTWFEPHQDGEKLAILSDAGILGLFGIRQPGNRDQALFPMLQSSGLDLSTFLRGERELPRERGRAQVVHMQGNDLWVLAHGQFQQVQLGWKDAEGLQAVRGWKEPWALGSPLHESQRIEDANGRSTFVLVTQKLEQQTCLVSKVDEEGKLLWQRQLGLVCQGEPLALTPPQGGPPLLLALDQGGGLFTLDPPQPPKTPRSRWRALSPALEENPKVPPRLLPAPDGHSAYEIAVPGDGRALIVRRIEWIKGERALRVKESTVSLVSLADGSVLTLAGAPAVVGTQLILAMTDGKLMRLPLAEKKLQQGPDWRDRLAPAAAPCHVLALGSDRFLITNGSRGLLVYDWPPDKDFQLLPKEGESLRPLPYLVAAPPVLLPSQNGQPPRVAVADSAGVLHLFVVKPDGSLQPDLTWELKGKLTTGPFVHIAPEGVSRIGCVLDRRHLVWIDPMKAEPLWTYTSGSAALVGQPRQVEDLLVVTLQSGHYVGLDPNSGQAKGPGYRLRTSAAPAASPMPFGPGRMFTPLSDGTALLLSVELLRQKKP